MIIKTECGLVETKDLLTIQKPIESHTFGWMIILKYNGKKEDIQLPAKDSDEANKCYEQIADAIIESQKPAGFSDEIRLSR